VYAFILRLKEIENVVWRSWITMQKSS